MCGTKQTSLIQSVFWILNPFLFFTLVCSSTVPKPNCLRGLAAVLTLTGSLNFMNAIKLEKTGVKWADAPESSIHSGFTRFEPDP